MFSVVSCKWVVSERDRPPYVGRPELYQAGRSMIWLSLGPETLCQAKIWAWAQISPNSFFELWFFVMGLSVEPAFECPCLLKGTSEYRLDLFSWQSHFKTARDPNRPYLRGGRMSCDRSDHMSSFFMLVRKSRQVTLFVFRQGVALFIVQ